VANLGASIYGLTQSAGLSGDASKVLAESNPFGQYRPIYGQQLLSLMQDPSSIAKQPGYQFLMDQGTQAAQRAAYAPGGVGAGGQLSADLMKYGQGLADQFYQQQISELSYLAGAGISPANPAQALQGKGGAATSLGSSIAGLTSGLGGTIGLLSKLFGGGGGGGGAAGSGLTPQEQTDLTSLFNNTYGAPGTAWDTGFGNVGAQMGYDPVTGQFSGNSTQDFSQFATGSGYSPTTGNFYGGGPGTMSLGDLGGGSGFDPGGGNNIDLSGLFSNPKAAGGEAANPNAVSGGGSGLSMGQILGTGSQVAGAVGGIMSGTPAGYATAGVDVAKLAANNSSSFGISSDTAGSLKTGAGIAGDVLGIYQGIEKGGATGYTQSAVSAAQLGSATGALPSIVGNAAGYAAIPLSVYNFVKNYQSGATPSEAMQGASAGATIGGVAFGPMGALVGGVIGGAVGAVASAFGPGRTDPETATVQGLINWTSSNKNSQAAAQSVQNPYMMLQGLMDEHHSDLPIYQKYGRADALGFTKDMTTQINDALHAGKISKTDSPESVFSKVVLPWVNSMGDWSKIGDTYQNVVSGLLQNMTAQYMQNEEYQNWTAAGGDNPFLSAVPFGGTYVPQPVGPSSSPGHTGGITRPN
jgi:hypothetical protein